MRTLDADVKGGRKMVRATVYKKVNRDESRLKAGRKSVFGFRGDSDILGR